jgi:tetratricopeptide (TPR) repeat protein
MDKFLSRLVKYSIYFLVFLVPLFFLPLSYEAFEYNKQYLLFFLVSLGFFAWLTKMLIYDKEIRFRWHRFDIFVLAFLFIAILTVVFSVDKDSSIFGFYGRFSNGLISLLSLGVFYFLITNNVSAGEEKSRLTVGKLINLFLWSGFVVILFSFFSVFGIWAKIGSVIPLPAIMLQKTFTPTAGSLEGLSIFLAVLVVFLVARLIFREKGKSIFDYLLALAALLLILIIDFTPAWIVILVSLVLFVGFSIWRRTFRKNVNRLLVPIFLIIIAATFIPLQPLKFNLPQEQILPQGISWSVGFKEATDSVKTGFLGSGIGTFNYDFAKQKPQTVNQTWLWQIRFDRAGNYLAEVLGTMGFLGFLSYLAMIGMFFLISLKVTDAKFQMAILPVFLAILVGQFVFYQNAVLAFLFWLILALSAVSWQDTAREKVISFKNFEELSLVSSTLTIILGVIFLVFYFFGVKYYFADTNYLKAFSVAGQERIEALEKAVKLNTASPRYHIILARAYLSEVSAELQKPGDEQDSGKIQNTATSAVNEAKIATTLQPNQVVNWEILGIIYRQIQGVASGATDWGIRSFERAIELEPTNPVLYTELGKLYLSAGENAKARENFEKAIEIKPDYIDVEALFQLGRLYFNDNMIDEAIAIFQNIIVLVPNHSNAHYSLGVAYAAKGQKDAALAEFEKVLELNPGNQDVIQKIRALRGY